MRKIIRRQVIGTFDERLHKAAEEISPEVPRGYVFKPQPGGFAIRALTKTDLPHLDQLPPAPVEGGDSNGQKVVTNESPKPGNNQGEDYSHTSDRSATRPV